jgi:3-hydroxyisobutyrate dehydrogenase-like beta-hydroxyacid dehydrogenase
MSADTYGRQKRHALGGEVVETERAPKSEMTDASRVGVVGLGSMGRAISACLIRAGRPLAVYDVRTEAPDELPAGTIIASRPSDVSAACDVVLIIVVDEAQVRDVLWGTGGLMESAREGLSLVVVSTIGVPALLDIAEKAGRSGVTLLDCGVSGGDVAATSGVVSMIGGDESAVQHIRPVLDDFSSRVFHMGPLGTGMSTKLLRNLITYCSWHVVYEAGVLAEQCGIDLAILSDVIESSYKGSGGLTVPLRRGTVAPMDPSDPDFDEEQYQRLSAALILLRKDLDAAQALAKERNVDVSVIAPTRADAARMYGLPIQAAGSNGNGNITTKTFKEA